MFWSLSPPPELLGSQVPLSSGLECCFPHIGRTLLTMPPPTWPLVSSSVPCRKPVLLHWSESQFLLLPPPCLSVLQPTKRRSFQQNERGQTSAWLELHSSKSTIISLAFILFSSKCFLPAFLLSRLGIFFNTGTACTRKTGTQNSRDKRTYHQCGATHPEGPRRAARHRRRGLHLLNKTISHNTDIRQGTV